jgi:protein O-mannosyl-transferase
VTGQPRFPVWRSVFLVVFLAGAAYANSLGNGFAFDDPVVIGQNPAVVSSDVIGALSSPYWPNARGGAGLYRPITTASFALDWGLWDGEPGGFHLVNVLLHVAVSLAVFFLLRRWTGPIPALAGASVFAVHPLHVEAVANVVGRAELLGALAVLLACLLYLRKDDSEAGRALRLVGISALYGIGLGSKEMAVTLPGILALLTFADHGLATGVRRLRRDAPLFISLTAVLGGYLLVRHSVLGTLVGELPAPYLGDLTLVERWLAAVSTWPQYLRLLFFPLDLVVDYGPAVLIPSRTVDRDVLIGVVVGLSMIWWISRTWRERRTLALGPVWFALTLLPVANLLFPTGVLLAERTLYLPSVGLSILVAGAAEWVIEKHPGRLRLAGVAGVIALALLTTRTVTRNPTWMSTFIMLDTLSREHPESFLSLRARAGGLASVGEYAEAERYYELSLEMAPGAYSTLVEVGRFYGDRQKWTEAERILVRAIEVFPYHPAAWQTRAEQLLLQGRGREAHHLAVEGLRVVGPDRELWALVSESYIAKGDLEAAARARWAALGAEPETALDWQRMADIQAMAGREEASAGARRRAEELAARERSAPGADHPLLGRNRE